MIYVSRGEGNPKGTDQQTVGVYRLGIDASLLFLCGIVCNGFGLREIKVGLE